MCIAGVATGLYAGVWWAFIGGIMDVITEIRADELDAMNIAIGIAKVMFAGAIGSFSAMVLFVPGLALIKA
ncbi:hypothetical protein [Nitrosospira sp. Nsp11]|uniref:hypothetical protein n=1 Tax=Nitrosospira sp. Nsp11 TaxID=1855338 RepID=UPI0009F86C2A|nr:hypothetical protein [Nitrosospira sp. Nsp11]